MLTAKRIDEMFRSLQSRMQYAIMELLIAKRYRASMTPYKNDPKHENAHKMYNVFPFLRGLNNESSSAICK